MINNLREGSDQVPEFGLSADFLEGVIYIRNVNDQSVIQRISGAVLSLTGHEPDDFLSGSVTWISLIVPEDQSKYLAATTGSSEVSLHHSIVKYRINHKTRGVVHVREKFKFCAYGTNNTVYCIGNVIDETLELFNAESQHELLAFREAIDRFLICTITDPKGVIVYANRKFSMISGYSIKTILGSTHELVNSGEQSSEFWFSFWNTIKQGKVWKGIIRNKTRQGHSYWEEKVVMPVFNASGKIRNYISLSFDVTDRVKLEEKANFFREAINVSPDMLFLVNPESLNIYDWNTRALYTLGYAEDTLRGIKIASLFQNISEDEIRYYINEVVQDNAPNGLFEASMFTSSGELLLTEVVFSVFTSTESGVLLVFSVRDITKKYEMQRALDSHKEELLEAGYIAKIGTWVWTPATDQVVLSEGAARIIDINNGERTMEFRDFQKMIHPGDLHILSKSIINIFSNGTPQAFNYRIATSSGTEKHVMLKRNSITYSAEGKIDKVLGFVQDITEYRLSQMENEYYHEKMEQLIFQTSHHLRASVSTILGVLELFKNKQLKEEEYPVFLNYISGAAKDADENLRFIFKKLQEGKAIRQGRK